MSDAVVRTAAVDLKLCFAGAAATDAAGQARHGGVLGDEARKQVLELGEFDLYLAVGAVGVLGEDVENELRSVEYFEFSHVGDGTKLRGIEVLVEDEDIGPELH